MDAHARAEVRARITRHPDIAIHTGEVAVMLDHLDVLDEEVRRLRLDLHVCAEDLRKCWAQA